MAQRVEAGVGGGLAGHRLERRARRIDQPALEQQLDVVVARVVVGRVDRHRLLQPLERGVGVAGGGQFLGDLGLGLGQHLLGGRHVAVEEGADLRLGQRADEAVDRLALVEQHAERDRAHAEGLAELAGDLGLLVAVELGQLETPAVGHFQPLEQRPERLAGPAPRRPDVEQHRLAHRVGDQVGFEILQGDVDHGGGSR